MALVSKSFSDLITFTRASSATRVNSSGLIETVSSDVARFDYDPVTLAPKGLLIEEQRTNLLTYSEQFDNAAWAKANITVTANSVVSPDGTTTADTLTPSAVSGVHTVMRTPSTSVSASYAFTTYVKANGYNYAVLTALHAMTSNGVAYVFDLVGLSASVYSAPGAGWTASASITDAGNGWRRCTLVITNPGTNPADWFSIAASPALGTTVDAATRSPTFTGDGTSGVYVWGAQLEAGSFATSYIPTTSATVTRAADVASITGTNFSDWFNAAEGTFVVEFDTLFTGVSSNTAFGLTLDGSSNKRLFYIPSGGDAASSYDGTNILNSTGDVTRSSASKVATAYNASGKAIVSNGGTVASGVVAAGFSTATSINIMTPASNNILNGHIRRLTYYPARLSNALLQTLST